MNETKKIIIVAAEASGDLLATSLIKSIQKEKTKIKIFGAGGKQMQATGIDILLNTDEISVVGFFEIFKHFKKIYRAFTYLKKILQQQRPDLLILVDYPGFNLRLAKVAKKMGIRVLYYVSPQIWVWHYSRIHYIKKYVDHMMVLFPFEEEIYRKENMLVTFVGHPIVAQVKPTLEKTAIYQQLGFHEHSPIITLMPGSRRQEIKRLLPIMLQSAQLIKNEIPNAQFAIPLAPSLNKADLQPYLTPSIRLIEKNTYNLLSISQAAIVASGTATLEAALLQIPMAIIYKLSLFTYPFAKFLSRATKYIGLCNIVLGNYIIKEFLQFQAKPKKISREIIDLIKNSSYRQSVLENLQQMRLKIDNIETACAAKVVIKELYGMNYVEPT